MSVQLMPMPRSLVQCPLGKPVLNSQFHDRQLPTGVDVLKPSCPKQRPSFSTSPLGPPSSPFSLLKSSCPILGHLIIYESSFTATISCEPLSHPPKHVSLHLCFLFLEPPFASFASSRPQLLTGLCVFLSAFHPALLSVLVSSLTLLFVLTSVFLVQVCSRLPTYVLVAYHPWLLHLTC